MKYEPVPFHILKEVLAVQDSKHKYCIDEDGYGVAFIYNYKATFYMNSYGDICPETIRCKKIDQQNTPS